MGVYFPGLRQRLHVKGHMSHAVSALGGYRRHCALIALNIHISTTNHGPRKFQETKGARLRTHYPVNKVVYLL